MPERTVETYSSVGIALCWLSLLILPLGLLAIGGGPCAGPRNIAGSSILFAVGLCAVGSSLNGVYCIFRSFKSSGGASRVLAVFSFLAACFATAVGALYLFLGFESLSVFLRYG
jgi:hypothetical protein